MVFGLPPIVEIVIICLGISLLYQLVYEFTINRKKLTTLKKRMNNIRKELKGMNINSKEYSRKQSQMLSINMEMMQLTMKPTLIMMIPFWGIFFLLSSFYKDAGVLIPVPSFLAWIPFGVGDGLGWLWTYLIFNMIFTTVLRKFLDRYYDRRYE